MVDVFGGPAAWNDYVARFVARFAENYEDEVRRHPDLPRRDGGIDRGLRTRVLSVDNRGGQVEFRSTAEHGLIIDNMTPGVTRPKKKKALANTDTGWGPYASAKRSTKHVGWWKKVTSDETFRKARDRTTSQVQFR